MKRQRKKHGYFVTFEGPEGSGKSTQIRRLANALRQRHFEVQIFREPGGTRISEAIRRILLDFKNQKLTPEVELLLYLAARAQIVDEKIRPALKRRQIVICDRFEDSTWAYQGFGRGFSLGLIRSMSLFARGDLVPDRTFFLDLDPREGFRRIGRRDRMEKQSMVFHHKVRRGYRKLARMFPKRIMTLAARVPEELLARKVLEAVLYDLG
ncbi:MAG: dTMP kinase [Candidatus Omnitrophota bacterium]